MPDTIHFSSDALESSLSTLSQRGITEFTLQDVAFFPLGHPEPGRSAVRVDATDQGSIRAILESLILRESSEGED